MNTYTYTAKDSESGQVVKAELQADSESSAAKLLQEQMLVPIAITPKRGDTNILDRFTGRISNKEKVLFARQLSTLINAGLPLVHSLRAIKDQIDNKSLLSIINQLVSDVEGGARLSDSMRKHPKVFNEIYVSLVAAGENSGSLDKSLLRIADQQEKDAAISSKIRGALVYPAIVMTVVGGVLVFMLVTVLPQIDQLYTDLDEELPLITGLLVATSNFIVGYWWLSLLVAAGVAYLAYRYLSSSAGKILADRFKTRVPVFGKLFMKLYMARFCRTCGTLLSSGLPMLEALRITRGTVNNVYVENVITKSIDQVRGGKALSLTLKDSPYFLNLVPQMIKIGEDSGTTPEMMERTAIYYEDELDNSIKNLSTTIEPVLIVVLGLTVGLIMAAILIPVYGLIGSPAATGGL